MDPAVRTRAQEAIWHRLGEAATVSRTGLADKPISVIWETLESTEVGNERPRRIEGKRIAVIRRSELDRALPVGSLITEAGGTRWRVAAIDRDDGTDIRALVTVLGTDVVTSGPGGA